MTCPPQVQRAASVPVRSAADIAVWDAVLRRLRQELAPLALEAWIAPLVVQATETGLRLTCPSAFHCERVRERFLARIERYAEQAAGAPVPLSLGVRTPGSEKETAGLHADPSDPAPADPAAARGTIEELGRQSFGQEAARLPRPRVATVRPRPARSVEPAREEGARETEPPRHDFAGFVSGRSNALAREACLALAQGRQLAMSPLYVVGRPGLGKTHLASACLHEARERGGRALYVSGEQFTNELMASIRSQRTAEFKRRYRELPDLLVFDDVHFLRGKRQTQLELLHTLEHLMRRGARIVLTADRLPREIPELDPRLASRLASGLCAEIEPPDAALRREIVEARAAALGARLPGACVDRLAEAVPGSVRDLEAAVIQIVASASLLQRRIDPALVEEALRKLLPRGATHVLDPERVAEIVAAHFQTTATALGSRSRRRDVLLPRQIAMYLCTRYTDASLQRIGQAFGRNHPAVANAVRAVERSLGTRPPLRERVTTIVGEIEALAGVRKGPRRAKR